MVDKRAVLAMVDQLTPEDFEEVYQHMKQRRQVQEIHKATGTFHAVQEERLREPAETIREEVNAVIDDAINVVKQKRKTQELAQLKS